MTCSYETMNLFSHFILVRLIFGKSPLRKTCASQRSFWFPNWCILLWGMVSSVQMLQIFMSFWQRFDFWCTHINGLNTTYPFELSCLTRCCMPSHCSLFRWLKWLFPPFKEAFTRHKRWRSDTGLRVRFRHWAWSKVVWANRTCKLTWKLAAHIKCLML